MMTREEFWSSPMGIALMGLIIGVVVILIVRGAIAMARQGSQKKPAGQQKPLRAFPVKASGTKTQNLSFPDDDPRMP